MPQQTKIFRVFVSSTFADMKEERKILQRDVFPKLEKFCELNGAKFQAVDLRWGVNEETSLKQQTLELCLKEIDRCQKISPKPNFIILMGDRYGWLPVPEKIPTDEMNGIQEMLTDTEKKAINNWYWLDENAIPIEYILQPREYENKEYDNWKIHETNIREILRKAVSSLNFTSDQKIKYFASATHQEIIRGALNPPVDGEKPEEHVLAFIRNIGWLPADNSSKDFIDLVDGKPDNYSISQLNGLKSELETKLGEHYITYPASWNDGESNILDKDKFSKDAYDFLEAVIKEQLKDLKSTDEIEHEVKLHKEFKDRLTEHFLGRDEILEKIQNYLNNKSEKRVLSLIGDSGSGKSSVMAKAIEQNENANTFTVYRFLGTSSISSNIISLLRNLCEQIAGKEKVESFAGEGKEKSLHEMQELTEVFRKCLALGTPEKPIVIFLDALDQLSVSDNARSLYWIPKELPVHVRIVISSTPELEKNLSHTSIEYLSILSKEEARLILKGWLDAANRKLTKAQNKIVIDNFSKSGLAIYLKLAFERAKQWHSYDKDITLKDDVKGIIEDFFEMLEKEHTKELVKNVVCYILCGRYQGLAENEILEILAFDEEYWNHFISSSRQEHTDELIEMKKELVKQRKEYDEQKQENIATQNLQPPMMKIPIVLWSRLFLDLEPFLTERDADGMPIITFFHRQFIEVLKKRYELIEENIKT